MNGSSEIAGTSSSTARVENEQTGVQENSTGTGPVQGSPPVDSVPGCRSSSSTGHQIKNHRGKFNNCNSSELVNSAVEDNDIVEIVDTDEIEVLEINHHDIPSRSNNAYASTSDSGRSGMHPGVRQPTHMKLAGILAGDTVYGLERGLKDPWREAYVEKIFDHIGKSVVKLTFTGPRIARRKEVESKLVSCQHVAYHLPLDEPNPPIPIGFRVIARTLHQDEKSQFFYAGIIAEIPTAGNKNRYLVFFDNGCAAYCNYDDIRIVPRANLIPKNTWSQVHPDSQSFIKEYIELCPNIVKATVRENSVITVEWNGKWWSARVVKIDCSLLKVSLVSNGIQIALWRGSDRLYQNYKQKRQENCPVIVTPPGTTQGKLNGFGVFPLEYEGKAVVHRVDEKYRINGKVNVDHTCSKDCLSNFNGTEFERQRIKTSVSPLAFPMYCGWDRGIIQEIAIRLVYYDAPCGKRLWSLADVQRFISCTESDIGIDCFNFQCTVDCLTEFIPTLPAKWGCEDISGGQEWVPVSQINTISDETAFCLTQYAPNTRLPLGLHLVNTQPEFLVCCDCTDNCQDKQKCACFRLTFETDPEFLAVPPAEFSRGYQHRRLFQKYSKGLYECNNWCKCRSTCINRVVQNGLQWKLQVFNTAAKGYAIRALQDIPQGSFICVYNGNILSGSEATEQGGNFGDEYLANLDFIEVAERWKEGYEQYVVPPQPTKSRRGRKPKTNTQISRPSSQLSHIHHDTNGTLPDPVPAPGGEPQNTNTGNNHDDAVIPIPINVPPTSDNDTESIPSSSLHDLPSETRRLFGEDQDHDIYAIDAKFVGNVGRFVNHSCNPNLFSQDVFVDTHDIRFPWVAFFAGRCIKAGTELTWDYNYVVGMADGRSMNCNCGAIQCRKKLL